MFIPMTEVECKERNRTYSILKVGKALSRYFCGEKLSELDRYKRPNHRTKALQRERMGSKFPLELKHSKGKS